jgi:hypothetical protein
VADKETAASKALAALRDKENRLKNELAELGKEREQHKQARLKELAHDAAAVADKVFRNIFSGQLSKDIETLRALSEEIMSLDGRAFQRLTGDGYGAESPAVGFYGKFVFEQLVNGRTLGDILPKCWSHSENIYKQ